MLRVGVLRGGKNQKPPSALQKSNWESCELRRASRDATRPRPGRSSTSNPANRKPTHLSATLELVRLARLRGPNSLLKQRLCHEQLHIAEGSDSLLHCATAPIKTERVAGPGKTGHFRLKAGARGQQSGRHGCISQCRAHQLQMPRSYKGFRIHHIRCKQLHSMSHCHLTVAETSGPFLTWKSLRGFSCFAEWLSDIARLSAPFMTRQPLQSAHLPCSNCLLPPRHSNQTTTLVPTSCLQASSGPAKQDCSDCICWSLQQLLIPNPWSSAEIGL